MGCGGADNGIEPFTSALPNRRDHLLTTELAGEFMINLVVTFVNKGDCQRAIDIEQ